MEGRIYTHGYYPDRLLTDPDEIHRRVEAFLNCKILRFNPYLVDDATLLACVERAMWLPYPALTQMVIFHFHDIRQVRWKYTYDAISFHIGQHPSVQNLSIGALTSRLTYAATLQQVHVTVDGQALTNIKMVERMQGKDYFVSHALPTQTPTGRIRPAYRMHRLRGSDSQRADTIRLQMIEAKITMLQELLDYPYTPQYLNCSRFYTDYTTPISAAIDAIRRFPQHHHFPDPHQLFSNHRI